MLDGHRARPAGCSLADGAAPKEDFKSVPEGKAVATLDLRIVNAEGLQIADSNGSSDAYCEAFVWCPDDPSCAHMWRTRTMLRTLSPRWDEERSMKLTRQDALLVGPAHSELTPHEPIIRLVTSAVQRLDAFG